MGDLMQVDQPADVHALPRAIVDCIADPLLVLDQQQRILFASQAYYRVFQSHPKLTEGELLSRLCDGVWADDHLARLANAVLDEQKSFDAYEIEREFPRIGRKVLLLQGRQLQQTSEPTTMLLIMRDVTGQRQQEERLRILQRAECVQQERQRIAHRLHDYLQQLLVAANMHVGVVRQDESDEFSIAQLTDVQHMLSDAIRATRDLTIELTPPVLVDSGLRETLEWIVAWMEQKHHLKIQLRVEHDFRFEEKRVCLLLFETIQELLFNVVKHAQVSHAELLAECLHNDTLQIVISDRGVGFDPAMKMQQSQNSGFGLSEIQHRLSAIGGSFEIDGVPGQGTIVRLRVPLRQTD